MISAHKRTLAVFLFVASACAEEYVPNYGEFPPLEKAHYFAGELVEIDHVNRRAGIRLDGDFTSDRYHRADPHRFAMLPYGIVRYRGAPADIRDLPIGTHVHGYFFLPPEGDNAIPSPSKGSEGYFVKFNHAALLEDDVSFYQSRGQSWKIVAAEPSETPASAGKLIVVSTGGRGADDDGLTGERTFEIDSSTRIWKNKTVGELSDLAAGQEIQLALTWAPKWENQVFHVSDIWLDAESLELAAELQRRRHVRHIHTRWAPGWVDRVEHEGASKGIVTLTIFAGLDESIYEEIRGKAKPQTGFRVACAEKTLRTWWQDHDGKNGSVVEIRELQDPPFGSSGLQLRLQFDELLEGFRPGRIVRLRCNDWPNVKLPPEERVKSMAER